MKIPKLFITYAYPLDNGRRKLFTQKNLDYYPTQEEVLEKINEWKKIWEEINTGDRVFAALTEITGVNFPHDLELYVYGAGLGHMSSPLMMQIIDKDGKVLDDNHFKEVVIHEIIHRFVHNFENNPGITDYWNKIREKYSNESTLTQNHIIVYAVLKVALIKLFGEEKIGEFMHPEHPDYVRAVAIVNEKGAETLVTQFKGFLK